MISQQNAEMLRARYGQNWQNVQAPFEPRATQESTVYRLPRSDITAFARKQSYKTKSKRNTKSKKARGTKRKR